MSFSVSVMYFFLPVIQLYKGAMSITFMLILGCFPFKFFTAVFLFCFVFWWISSKVMFRKTQEFGEDGYGGQGKQLLIPFKDLHSSFHKAQSLTEHDNRVIFLSADNCDIFPTACKVLKTWQLLPPGMKILFYPPLTV